MLRLTGHRALGLALLAFLSALPANAEHARPGSGTRNSVSAQTSPGPLPVFEFHSGFWTNLHHFLYQQARLKRPSEAAPSKNPVPLQSAGEPVRTDGLSPEELAAWNAAVDYYAKKLAEKDLLFNGDMVNYKNRLTELENCADLTGRSDPACDAGLPPEMARALEAAARVYRAHWWTEHDRANRAWIAGVTPRVRQMGGDLAQRLAEVYQARWPAGRIRVDVTVYANWSGAYTTLDPVDLTISSSDSRNQGAPGFEILFHEASHALAERVSNAIVRECRERGKPIPRDLWHALLFYTTGEIVQRAVSSPDNVPGTAEQKEGSESASPSGKPGASYIPYAVRNGLYTRGWSGYLQLLERFWQPYLDGKTDFDTAIARLVSSL
ncbi:MAG TPA: hypothetical protein VEU31_01265 [Candidatus Acidoferrales bacterium]|nr:hypothetical protein [Candidatus Acidoferrales bacterium]